MNESPLRIEKGIFVTNITPNASSLPNSPSTRKHISFISELNNNNTSINNSLSSRNIIYSLPILKQNPPTTTRNTLLYHGFSPYHPPDKSSFLNFNTNPKLLKSYSKPLLIHRNILNNNNDSIINNNNIYDYSIIESNTNNNSSSGVMIDNNNPYTPQYVQYMKNKQILEIQKRSNNINKIISCLYRSTSNRDCDVDDCSPRDNVNSSSSNSYSMRYGESYGSKMGVSFPKVKDIIKRKLEKAKQCKHNEFILNKLSNKKLQNELIKAKIKFKRKIPLEQLNNALLNKLTNKLHNYKKSKSCDNETTRQNHEEYCYKSSSNENKKIKMTPTHIRDLKIIQAFNKIQDPSLIAYMNFMIKDSL